MVPLPDLLHGDFEVVRNDGQRIARMDPVMVNGGARTPLSVPGSNADGTFPDFSAHPQRSPCRNRRSPQVVPPPKLCDGHMETSGNAPQRVAALNAIKPDAVANFRSSSARTLRRHIATSINLQRSPCHNLRTAQMVPPAEAFNADMEVRGNGA